jgi:hypothetical protein
MSNKKLIFSVLVFLSVTIIVLLCIIFFIPEKMQVEEKRSIKEARTTGKILIDYGKPSFRKRLWLMEGDKVLLNTYVSHGKNSGLVYARSFSNTENSLQSSIGHYVTSEIYYGDHGLSMRVIGLDSTNSNAYNRDIVFHSAPYATKGFLLTHGYLGRSHGCFVTGPNENKKIIDFVRKNGPIEVIVTK